MKKQMFVICLEKLIYSYSNPEHLLLIIALYDLIYFIIIHLKKIF